MKKRLGMLSAAFILAVSGMFAYAADMDLDATLQEEVYPEDEWLLEDDADPEQEELFVEEIEAEDTHPVIDDEDDEVSEKEADDGELIDLESITEGVDLMDGLEFEYETEEVSSLTSQMAATSGSCGNGVTWSYVMGTLNIMGTGSITEYDYISAGDEEDEGEPESHFPWEGVRTQIRSIVIADGVTNIPAGAFWGCASLQSVSIGKNVKTIGEDAFYFSENLTFVQFSEESTLTTIGNGAFDNCSGDEGGITKLQLPDTVETIGDYAFDNCEKLKTITFGKKLQSIGEAAFVNCSSLDHVELPDSVQSIGDEAFENCEGLTEITVGKGLTSIGESAFSGCVELEDIKLPKTVTSLKDTVFADCEKLKEVHFKGHIPTIGMNIFSGIEKLTAYYPEGNAEWEKLVQKKPTYGADDVEWLPESEIDWKYSDGTLTIYEWNENVDEFETIEDQPWYEKRQSVNQIVVKEGVEKIGDFAFSELYNVSYILMPESVFAVGIRALPVSVSMGVLPPDVRAVCFAGNAPSKVGVDAFEGWNVYYLEDMTGWSKPKWNGYDSALWGGSCGMDAEWRFSFPKRTINITGTGSMTDYANVQDVPWYGVGKYIKKTAIAEGIDHISNHGFEDMSSIETSPLPSTIQTIGDYAFKGTGIKKVTFTEQLLEIGAHAFQGTKIGTDDEDTVVNIVFFKTITKIGESAFEDCKALKRIKFLGEPEKQNDAAFTIGDRAFYGCQKLLNAVFERDAPASIGKNAFDACAKPDKSNNNLDKKIGFVITYKVGKRNWSQRYTEDLEHNKYKTESTYFSPWKDIWQFENDMGVFGTKYFLLPADRDKLSNALEQNVLEEAELDTYEDQKFEANDWNTLFNRKWGGSCYGMSEWVYLLASGVKKLSALPGYRTGQRLMEVTASDEVLSAINYYHVQQHFDGYRVQRNSYKYSTFSTQLLQIRKLAEEAESGKGLMLLDYYIDKSAKASMKGAHTVIGYGLEEIDQTYTVAGKEEKFVNKVLIYDCNKIAESQCDRYDMYLNDHMAYIPAYNLIITRIADTGYSDDNTGYLINATNDPSVFNLADYSSGALSLSAQHASYLHKHWLIGEETESYTLFFWRNGEDRYYHSDLSDGEGTTIEYNQSLLDDLTPQINQTLQIVETTQDSNDINQYTNAEAIYSFSQSLDNMAIRPEKGNLDLRYINGEYYVRISADKQGIVGIGENGQMIIQLDEPGEYDIKMTANAEKTRLPGHTLLLNGKANARLSVQYVDEGLMISGDNLKETTLTVCNSNQRNSQSMDIASDEECVLLRTSKQNSAKVTIYTDPDGDGVFDNPIDPAENKLPETEKTVDTKPEDTKPAVTKPAVTKPSKPAKHTHTYGAWTVTRQATVLQKGVKKRICSGCKDTQTTEIPKLTPTIKLNATSLLLQRKKSTTALKVTGLAAGDYITGYTTSNPKIVTVTKAGKITAGKKTGKASITITLASGLTKKVNVKVQKKAVTTKSVKGVPKNLIMRVGSKETLLPELNPITSTQKITYKSSKAAVVAVSKKGVLTAKKKGTAKITVKSGKKKATVKVTVK